MDKKHKGAASELIATAWLLKQGYEVFRNVSQHGKIDLIAIHPETDEIKSIDVKTLAESLGDKGWRKADLDSKIHLLAVDLENNRCRYLE